MRECIRQIVEALDLFRWFPELWLYKKFMFIELNPNVMDKELVILLTHKAPSLVFVYRPTYKIYAVCESFGFSMILI